MCPAQIVNAVKTLFGGNDSPAPPPVPAAPTPPPTPTAPVTAPVTPPPTPTPSPYSEDETKKKAKITGKKVLKKKRSAGTSQLQTKDKPSQGGLQGINTPQGVNTAQQPAAPAPTQPKKP